MTHSNIDLIKSIKYKYANKANNNLVQGNTHSFHNYMKQFSNGTQSLEEKIKNFKEIIGYTSSHSFTYSFTHSYTHSSTFSSRHNFSFTGLTNSNLKHSYFGTISNYLATQSYSFNNSFGTYSNKFYTKITHGVVKLDNQPFVNIVSKINSVSLDEANKLITNKKVTVNGLLITDSKYQLKSFDIVRIGFEGHFLNNIKGIAIIK
jgi:hypothetical protein